MNSTIERYISNAIKHDAFEIHYQPQFTSIGDIFVITGAEALLRPDPSICQLNEMLEVAVHSALIDDLGYWVLSNVAKQIQEWNQQGIISEQFNVSINVAAEQLADDNFCCRVCQILQDFDILPSQITLELTETSMIDDRNIDKVHKLTDMGINISIDDFGTGYSSLWRLKKLPVNEIKIDKMFINDLTKDKDDVALITAMFQLTNALNKPTIVEGVETIEQYHCLRDIGFTNFQGWHFSEAIPSDRFSRMVSLVDALRCQESRM